MDGVTNMNTGARVTTNPANKGTNAELLRQVLPLLGKYGSDCEPTSYAIFYEHVRRSNPALSARLEPRLARGEPLSRAETLELFGQHVAALEGGATAEIRSHLERVLVGALGLASDAALQARDYGEALSGHAGMLTGDLDPTALQQLVGALASETLRMRASNEELARRLETSHREMTSIKGRLEAVQSEAVQDSLTALCNRRGLDRFVAQLLAERATGLQGASIVMADIDHFKLVNDKYGHVFGDTVLKAVAAVLKATVKGGDCPARYGGEEFAIVLPDTSAAGALTVAEQIRRAVASSRIRQGDGGAIDDRITISLGVAAYRRGEAFDEWLARADAALYESKRAGRNRVTASPE